MLWIAAFCGRLVATALIIIAAARVAERTGPFLASTILTLPLFAGPSYFFLLDQVPASFIAESALYAFAGTGPVLAFTAGFVRAVQFWPLFPSLLAASAAWLLLALPIRAFALSLGVAVAWCVAGALVAYLSRRPLALHAPPASARSRWLPVLLRALAAGFAVALVSELANSLGPALTGLLVSFPVTLSVSAWFVHSQFGGEFAAAVLASTQRTLLSYASFCLALSLLCARLPADLAFWSAAAVAAVSAFTLALWGHRAARR